MVRLFSCFAIMLCSSLTIAQSNPVGIFENHADIGNPKNRGSAQYNEATQTYTLSGSGYNIWFGRDEFHYLYSAIKGDFMLTATVEFIGSGTDPHRKIGWMIRSSTDDNAPHITAAVHGDGLTSLQWRDLRGAYMRDPEDQLVYPKKHLKIIQLERKGKTFTMKVANWGEPLQGVGSHEMTMPDEILAGLFICSHNAEVTEQARMWNVRIEKTVPDSYNGYTDGALRSKLEIMNVHDGTRTVIHESDKRFEAPNWMPDGKKLLFNEGGSLYTIPVTGGTPEKLNTGMANRNNNDHGISFNKKMLAISHHRDGLPGGGSTIYILPLTGGEPKLITEKTPSYWHSWSPDDKELIYTAQREDKKYNIYKIPVTGGKETQLTFAPLADGPEYTPDGNYIYFNATYTGTMKLWRMKPDGSRLEQITFDEYNDWFPHFSPDGKWMVFVSFLPTIDPNDHPFYKKVMLRLMPASGGAPKVIAYLFGGQGTINVPSWSPDGKYIAFVSNTK